MKTAPGSPKTGEQILGREREVASLHDRLKSQSVLFTAERRVGKSCILQKLVQQVDPDVLYIKCFVEHLRHPAELVRDIREQLQELGLLTKKKNALVRFQQAYEFLAGTEVSGWHLPPVRQDWKKLLNALVQDIVEHSDRTVVIVLDELPHMVDSIIADGHPELAMEFLDTIRRFQHEYEAKGKFRWLLAGSIGLHLIVDKLKIGHGYRGSPTNALAVETLSGMSMKDVELMCQKYLDEEGISRKDPGEVAKALLRATDGLPLYIEYICDQFQASRTRNVSPADVERELKALLDSTAVEWFFDAADRISTHYSTLRADTIALETLGLLSRARATVAETDIIEHVMGNIAETDANDIRRVLELLRQDHYLTRTVSKGQRRYKFQYTIMRRWWRLNRG